MMHSTLIIPTLNEAESIGPLLAEIPAEWLDQVIVVDNGSTDGTGEIARLAGVQVIQEPRRGYGYACAAGALAAEGDILVFMDGDGSFVPGEFPSLVAPIERGEADLVLGSRVLANPHPDAMPSHQLIGNRLVVWLLQRQFGKMPAGIRLSDLGPYRAIPRDLLSSLNMQELTYGWSLEMIIKAARLGKRMVELPITYRPRYAGKSKVGGSLRGTILVAYRFFRIFSRYAF
jgi:glycosyltransferase involved in cell wall biosynthesis